MVCSFKKSQNNNIIPITIKVVRKCESKHWCSCGADGQLGGRAVGQCRFTKLWGSHHARASRACSPPIIPITINVMTSPGHIKNANPVFQSYSCLNIYVKAEHDKKIGHNYTKKTVLQGCQLSQIIRETPDFEPFFPVSRLESEINRIIAKVFHFL